jgi:hypothetical protein
LQIAGENFMPAHKQMSSDFKSGPCAYSTFLDALVQTYKQDSNFIVTYVDYSNSFLIENKLGNEKTVIMSSPLMAPLELNNSNASRLIPSRVRSEMDEVGAIVGNVTVLQPLSLSD